MKAYIIILIAFFSLSFTNKEDDFICPNYEFYIQILNDNNNQVNSFKVNNITNSAVTNSTTKFWPAYVNSYCNRSNVYKFEKQKTYVISRPNSINCVCIKFLNNYKLSEIAEINYDEETKKFSVKSLGSNCEIQINNKINGKCGSCTKKINVNESKLEKDVKGKNRVDIQN
jgi:hypothetical protein